MSSFEMDGEAEDPFADDEETAEQEPSEEPDEHSELDNQTTDVSERDHSDGRSGTGAGGLEHDQSHQERASTITLSDLSVNDTVDAGMVAQAMVNAEYSRESPPVPYAVWRERTSVGRGKKTIEYNDSLDDLVDEVQDEFEDQYDTSIYLSDIRMCAMAYGLMNPEALFEMFEEWGIPYDR